MGVGVGDVGDVRGGAKGGAGGGLGGAVHGGSVGRSSRGVCVVVGL
jgi:hypothetical protein